MNMRLVFVLFFVILSGTASSEANASALTKKEWQVRCDSLASNFSTGHCLGYLDGIIDGMHGTWLMNKGRRPNCIPIDTPHMELFDKVLAFFKARPREDDEVPASAIIALALEQSYPCAEWAVEESG